MKEVSHCIHFDFDTASGGSCVYKAKVSHCLQSCLFLSEPAILKKVGRFVSFKGNGNLPCQQGWGLSRTRPCWGKCLCREQTLRTKFLPNIFHPLECEEWYQIPMTLATQCIGWVVSFACCAMVSFATVIFFLGCLCAPPLESRSSNFDDMAVVAGLAIAGIVGIAGAMCIMQVLNPHLHWSLFVPKQIQSCEVQLLQTPPLLPSQAGATLEPTQLTQRQHFFFSLLALQLLTAWLLGMSLTFLARICRACQMSNKPSYAAMEQEVQFNFALVEHLSFHFFFASVTCLGLMTHSFSVATGSSWELYVLFVGAQTASNVLEALYWAVYLPADAGVPAFGWPVVSSVLPVFGEPLDTCKDYFFAGIALSTSTWQGPLFAAIAIGILVFSNIYLSNKYHHALGRDLLSVRKACFPSRAEGFLATQTSPTKLAIALSEDLPQAVLQSLFVLTCGGSPMQYAFIGLSITKILCCLSLRAIALRRDDRHGEASAANIEFFQMMIFALSFVVGPEHSLMLLWKSFMADSLAEVGRRGLVVLGLLCWGSSAVTTTLMKIRTGCGDEMHQKTNQFFKIKGSSY